MTRRKRTRAAGPNHASASDTTIAPPPLDPSDAEESDAPAGPAAAPVEEEEIQLDLSLAVPPDDEFEESPAAADPDPADTPSDLGQEAPVATATATAGDETDDVPTAAEHGDEGSSPDLEIEEARDLTREHLRGLLEALIFAADKPMSTGELCKMASAPLKQVRATLAELKPHYAGRGIVLDEVAGGWLFRTNAQFAPFVRELTSERPVKLTRAQVETLAIAAYRQPITRPEIDEIRGVDSGATLKLLLERDLLRILGKKDEPGRPLLYGTTTHFLEFFGLKSLKDLPTLREFTELSDESRRVAEAELGDVLGEAPIARRAAAPPVEPLTAPVEFEPVDPESDAVAHPEPDAPPLGFDDESAGAHDTVIPSAPPTGKVDDPDGPAIDEG